MFELSREHRIVAAKRRRTLAQYDTYDIIDRGGRAPLRGENPLEEYRRRLVDYLDHVANTVDSVLWDPEWPCGEEYTQYPSASRPRFTNGFYGLGTDMYRLYTTEGRIRGLENILNHRVNGSDPYCEAFPPRHKMEHPELYLHDWWKYGLQNMAEPEIRLRKQEYILECLEKYEFDGIQMDFCRHTPFLPVGRQWELRGEVTQFLANLRASMLEMETRKGRPLMLFARVPQTVEGAEQDGLDVETWALERIVDGLTLGSRSYEVDVENFRKITYGLVQLFPCFDYHHCTDGYANAPIEVARGVFANWWAQGADGIVLFNWMGARLETYRNTGTPPFRLYLNHEEQELAEVGDFARLQAQTKTFVVERRGGYPWGNGFANHNMEKQLPMDMGRTGCGNIWLRTSEASDSAELMLVFSDATNHSIFVELNGVPLEGIREEGYRDKLIRTPEPVSGFQPDDLAEVEGQQLTRWTCRAAACRRGMNCVRLTCSGGRLEKMEITIQQKGR